MMESKTTDLRTDKALQIGLKKKFTPIFGKEKAEDLVRCMVKGLRFELDNIDVRKFLSVTQAALEMCDLEMATLLERKLDFEKKSSRLASRKAIKYVKRTSDKMNERLYYEFNTNLMFSMIIGNIRKLVVQSVTKEKSNAN